MMMFDLLKLVIVGYLSGFVNEFVIEVLFGVLLYGCNLL